MEKADVMKEISDSFGLLRAHYREVLFPLLVLLVLSGAGHFGFSGLRWTLDRPFGQLHPALPENASPFANAMLDASSFLLLAGGALLALILAYAAIAIVSAILERAVWFYVFEHFHAVIRKKRPPADWQQRMKRHAVKSVVFMVFWAILAVAVFAVPALQAWDFLSSSGSFFSFFATFVIAIVVFLGLAFLLLPLWVFYAIDGHGLFESVSKSASLVGRNLVPFGIYAAVFFAIWILALAVSIGACCLSFIVAPVAFVFIQLLSGVTLMKLKLVLETGG